jgi:hypothetical protein
MPTNPANKPPRHHPDLTTALIIHAPEQMMLGWFGIIAGQRQGVGFDLNQTRHITQAGASLARSELTKIVH